ncbi:hypothetical protein [Streptomyces sp. NPDC058855]|uniref:hypothetical protein n=1 Tax=Streptomyces sp. NPDC058855 TaxID=3346651 RepID=UPI003690759D
MRVILDGDDPLVETILYVPFGTRDALWSGLLHSDDQEDALKRIQDAAIRRARAERTAA